MWLSKYSIHSYPIKTNGQKKPSPYLVNWSTETASSCTKKPASTTVHSGETSNLSHYSSKPLLNAKDESCFTAIDKLHDPVTRPTLPQNHTPAQVQSSSLQQGILCQQICPDTLDYASILDKSFLWYQLICKKSPYEKSSDYAALPGAEKRNLPLAIREDVFAGKFKEIDTLELLLNEDGLNDINTLATATNILYELVPRTGDIRDILQVVQWKLAGHISCTGTRRKIPNSKTGGTLT